jgi:Fur family ferric uptake transcriptional regulator
MEHERPLRVEEILDLARENAPTLNVATVYRNLNRLVDDGWLKKVELPPLGAVYERSDRPHHHYFFCRLCNAVFELPGCMVDMEEGVPTGLTVEGHELFLHGLCETCSKTARHSK